MSRTQKTFIWASAIGIAVFGFFAAVMGAEILDLAPTRGTSDRFFMLVWLAAALVIFVYYVVKGVYQHQAPGGREIFLTLWLALIYACAVAGLSYLAHG